MASFYLGGMEMKSWKNIIGFGFALLFLFTILPLKGPIQAEPVTGLETAISGTVRDEESLEPIPGITIVIVNFSDQRVLTAMTDENGYFHVQVGTGGSYRISLYTDNKYYVFCFFEEYVKVETFKERTVDIFLKKDPNNMHFYITDNISDKPLQNIPIEIVPEVPPAGEKINIKTAKDGYSHLFLEPGNYSFSIKEPYYNDFFEKFELSNDTFGFFQIKLEQVMSGPDSEVVFANELISIPAHSYAAIKMDMPRETKVWIDFDANDQLKVVRLTEEMYLEYLAKNRSFSGPVENPDHISYDCISWTRGGGGQVNLWREPYYLLLFNEANETVEVNDLRMKWSQGPIEDVKVEINVFPLEESANDSNKKSSTMIYLFPILFIIILIISSIIFLYNYYRNNKD